MTPIEDACAAYRSRFGAEPEVASFAPGRVEIIGNHTDYNGGHVMPVGLELGVAIAAGKMPGCLIEIFSSTLDESDSFDLDAIDKNPERAWSNYPKGVLRELLLARVPVSGMRLAVASTLPFGAGVSSSAAFELAVAEAAYGLFGGRPADPMEEALLCQRAEVGFVGMPCGLLDQFSSLFARAGSALFLDCATLDWSRMDLGDGVSLVLADTKVKHALVDGKYAALRQSCERAAGILGGLIGKPVRFLRDVSPEEFGRFASRVPEEDRKRARHVIEENERVLRGKEILESGRVRDIGALMLESHASSRDLFGNSCRELDVMVDEARRIPGFIGGKLSGGGFGGCTVNLVEEDRAGRFAEALSARYRESTGIEPRMIRAGIGDGARVERIGGRG